MTDSAHPVRPTFKEIDAWGVTHQGKVRATNQDHFFVGSLARGAVVDRSSTGAEPGSILHPERMASLAVVADGVGSAEGGEEAARVAVDDLVASVATLCRGEVLEGSDPEDFSDVLHDAALGCHDSLLRRAEEAGGERRFATTLTLFLGFWPHAYLLQVGDSRCYIYQRDTLTLVTRDQTWAQELMDAGQISRTEAEQSRWANVLSSAIGGIQATPVVTRITREFGAVVILCSDGLTRHVSEEQITARIREMRDSRQLAEQLVQDALDGGGVDNVTVVVGRTRHPDA
jgi:protein phosphatase